MAAKKKTTGNTISSDLEKLFNDIVKKSEQKIDQKSEEYEGLLPNDLVEAIRQINSEEYQKLQALIVEKIKQLPEQRLRAITVPKGPYGTSENIIYVESAMPVYVVYDEDLNFLYISYGDWLSQSELSELDSKLSKFNNSTENESAVLEVVSPVAKKYQVPIIHGLVTMSLNDLKVLAAQLGIDNY